MAEAILKDKKKILPCAAYLQGEYGVNGLFVGVPVKLGRSSVNTIEVKDGLNVGDQVILSDMSAQDAYNRIRLN